MPTSELISFGARARALLSPSSIHLIPNVISAHQERALVAELDPILRRRRVQQNHWDKVIIGYKEVLFIETTPSLFCVGYNNMILYRLSVRYGATH